MNWRFSLFLVLLFCLLAAFSLAPWNEFLCKQPLVIDLLKQNNKDGAIGCFEFWFNRYQTLVGTIAAVGAATAAWLASQGQISAAKHQAEIGRQQYAAAALPVLEKLLQSMNEADAAFASLDFSLARLINRVINANRSLEVSYKFDGNAMGPRFRREIAKIVRSSEEFEKEEVKFEILYKEAVAAGSRMIVSQGVFREHIGACETISIAKTECIHAFIDYENIFNSCKDGEVDIADSIWQSLSGIENEIRIKKPDRSLLKDAQKQASAKIENIVNALVS